MLGICLLFVGLHFKQYCVNLVHSEECIQKWVMDDSSLFNGKLYELFGDNFRRFMIFFMQFLTLKKGFRVQCQFINDVTSLRVNGRSLNNLKKYKDTN